MPVFLIKSDAILVKPEDKELLTKIGKREKCPIDFVGTVTGDGYVRLIENNATSDQNDHSSEQDVQKQSEQRLPVELELSHVLGSMPRKVFKLDTQLPMLSALRLPNELTVLEALNRVLRLPSVASKRYLTNKVDRSVTGEMNSVSV